MQIRACAKKLGIKLSKKNTDNGIIKSVIRAVFGKCSNKDFQNILDKHKARNPHEIGMILGLNKRNDWFQTDLLHDSAKQRDNRKKLAKILQDYRKNVKRKDIPLKKEIKLAKKWKEKNDRKKAEEFKYRLEMMKIQEERDNALLKRCIDTIHNRGGETSIETKNGFIPLSLEKKDEKRRFYLVRASGFRYYSARQSWYTSLSYLCGEDDSGFWAVRIPGNIKSINTAIEWITPKEVKKAEEKGKRVKRQGDIYLVETLPRYDERGNGIDSRHSWSSDNRWLLHPEHAPLMANYPAKVYFQKTLSMGRGGKAGFGAD